MSKDLNTVGPLEGETRESPLPDPLSCEHCAREIPSDRFVHREVREYAHYFCSHECRVRWRGEDPGSQAEAERQR